jgi:hypothetical protein
MSTFLRHAFLPLRLGCALFFVAAADILDRVKKINDKKKKKISKKDA